MICSVLIPTRKRVDRLIECINSIRETSNIYEVEILLRIDDDDTETISVFHSLRDPNCICIIRPRGKLGYFSNADYYNELADISKGDWIWIMNDDITVLGAGWDEQLKSIPTEGFIVHAEFHKLNNSLYVNDADGVAPIVPRGCWAKLGYDKIPYPPDAALNQMCRNNGWVSKFLTGITVHHKRDDDETLAEHRK